MKKRKVCFAIIIYILIIVISLGVTALINIIAKTDDLKEDEWIMKNNPILIKSRKFNPDQEKFIYLISKKMLGNNSLKTSVLKNGWMVLSDKNNKAVYLTTKDSVYGTPELNKDLIPLRLIAHGGGIINGKSYTNSLEAVNNSYKKGFRIIEIDIDKTSDNRLVCIHDWDGVTKNLFNAKPKVYTYDEFKNLKMTGDLTQMTLETLVKWMEKHKDAYIVTDIKNGNVGALKYISEHCKNVKQQFIPQVYSFEEYDKVRSFGYENIILTLYRSNYSDDQIVNFVKTHPVFSVTIPYDRILKSNIAKRLESENIFIYSHTINDEKKLINLCNQGVNGIYTDSLTIE